MHLARLPAVLGAMIVMASCSSAPAIGQGSPSATGARVLPSPGSGAEVGAIAGRLNYPAGVIFPQLAYAISTAGVGHGAYSVESTWGQGTYTIDGVAPGTYLVYSVVRSADSSPAGATSGAIFSKAVPCGLDVTCTDHSPIPVEVTAGRVTEGIDIFDWYWAPPLAAFQPPPTSIVPVHSLTPFGGSFASAREAAGDFAMDRSLAMLVENISSCPMNRACAALGVEVDGSGAAYFAGQVGSNRDMQACGTYVFRDASGWRALDWLCHKDRVFPAVGQSGTVQLGIGAAPSDCANVRAAPGPSGKAVACLKQGTAVQIDSGPNYAPGLGDGLWWHVAARGWIVHDFIRNSP